MDWLALQPGDPTSPAFHMCTTQGQRAEGSEATGGVLRLQRPVPPASPQIFHDSRPESVVAAEVALLLLAHSLLTHSWTIPKLPVRDSAFHPKVIIKVIIIDRRLQMA